MNESDVCCARMVRYVLDQVYGLIGHRPDQDLQRFAIAKVDSSSLSRAQQKAIKGIVDSLYGQTKSIEAATNLIDAAEFKGAFAHNCVNDLFRLAHLISQVTSDNDPRAILAIEADVRKELDRLLAETRRAIDPCLAGVPAVDHAVFTILLLSDFHWGAPGCESRWKTVKEPLFNGLQKTCHEGNPFDLVVFSGDLAFSGKWDEYDGQGQGQGGINGFLTDLWAQLTKNCRCNPPLVAVPGNHDLRRPSSPAEVELAESLKKYHKHGDVWEKIWNEKGSDHRALVSSAFEEYTRWQNYNLAYQIREKTLVEQYYQRGELPGDFSYRLKKDRNTLGIVGLNSSFLHTRKGNLEGQMAIENDQVQAVGAPDIRTWLKQNDANIVVTHHPVSWLHQDSQKTFCNDVCIPERVDVHLHGHLHVPEYRETAHQPGKSVKSVQGISLFGEESYFDHKKHMQVDRLHGYTVVEIKVMSYRNNLLRFRPRQITADGRDIPALNEIAVRERDGWTEWVEMKRG